MNKRLFSILMLVVLWLGSACADPDLTLQDSSVRSGPWRTAYIQILEAREAGIQAYREYVKEVTSLPDCRPVHLTDLNGDGIPELIFLDLVEDTEYGFRVGRLWIYTRDGTGVHCALSLQPEIDDLLYSSIYLGKKGLLTLYFNDCEMGWKMQLQPGRDGKYQAKTILNEQEDFSGEGPNTYYRNGTRVSRSTYQSAVKKIQAAQGSRIGSLQPDAGEDGFSLTLEEALEALTAGEDGAAAGCELFGLAVQKLATRKGPGTQYEEGGTYSVKGQNIKVLARAWDSRNGTWWVKCEIPYKGKIRVLWTGYSRFDAATLPLENIPIEDP